VWDTSNVTNMSYIFSGSPIIDVSHQGWDTSRVNTMGDDMSY